MKSADGGKTWNLIAASSFARASFKRIRVHPTNPNVVLAATARGGFGRDSEALSASPTWVNVGPSWNQPFNVIRVDPRDTNIVYAGSDIGLWIGDHNLWRHVGAGTGLFSGSIYDIQINPATGVTAAFTYGRGAYVLRGTF
jgi:hypothetical protein